MKKHVVSIFVLFTSASIAQPVRLHIMGGFANYSGDIQPKRLTLDQSKSVVTIGGTFNITEQLLLRADFSFASLGADDKKSSTRALVARNLNFKTNIKEFALMGEYDIRNINEHPLIPYVFGGVGVFKFDPYTYDSKGNKAWLQRLSTEGQGILPGKKVYKTTQFNLPVGGGVKYALSGDIQVAVEMGLRITNTDHLDDVSGPYVDQALLLQQRGPQAVDVAFRGDEVKTSPAVYPKGGTIRGGPKVKDYYYFGQFRISFRMPWFDGGGGGGGGFYKKSKSGLGCPSWKR